MIVVIIAGGAGTRLWPLSTPDYPKHLLRLTNENSLLQNTYNRVKKLTNANHVFVVPEASHANHVYDQLPDVPRENVLVEPGRRGTASCFLLALKEIKSRKMEKQAIFFLWSDHIVMDTNGFTITIKQAASLAEQTEKIVFVGAEPTYASAGYGYLEKGERLENGFKAAFKLQHFIEKPDRRTAMKYFRSGNYLWNTGYLVASCKALENEIEIKAPELWHDYQALLSSPDVPKTYLGFKSHPIDTALSEKIDDGLVVPASFNWLDVGSFQDLHGVSEQDDDGNTTRGDNIELEQVTNSYVRNEQELPVAVIGVDNLVVVATPRGILITNKTHSQLVGEMSKKIEGKR